MKHAWVTAAVMGLAAMGHSAGKEGGTPRKSNSEREGSHLGTEFQAQALRKMAPAAAAPWAPEGPYGVGRFNVAEVDPANDQVVYAGAGGGGVWKSTNGGVAFTQIFNDYDQSVGAIAVDPNNSQIVWVGGGENIYGGGSLTYPGTGIFKSVNGGTTWQRMGLDSSFYISRISVTPGNSNQVFVAVQGSVWGKNTYRGVYRTQDGGATWQQVLGPRSGTAGFGAGDDSTGAVDVRIHPTITTRIFANMFSAQRLPYARNWGGPTSRVWRSDDGGTTWVMMANGLPTTDLGKSTMDICLSNPNVMYMIYMTSSNTIKNVYKSTDGGLNWTTISTLNANGGNLFSYYGHTFCQIRVNPSNANDVVVLGISSYRSTDGGNTWGGCFTGGASHADHRGMAWSRTNGNIVYLADDGGLKRSTGGPNGTLTNSGAVVGGIHAAMLYSIDVDPANAAHRIVGHQDNGGLYTNNSGGSWAQFVGGDGMQQKIDHGAGNNVVGCLQYGTCYRSSTGGSGPAGISYPGTRKLWDAGVAIDSVTGHSYLGSEFVSRAARGSAAYTQISTDLTNGDHSLANYPMGTVSAISAHNGVVFAGTDDGNVSVNLAANTGNTWTRIRNGNGTGPGPGERAYDGWVKLISHDMTVTNGTAALIAVSYFRWGIRYWKPAAYRVTMNGTTPTWQDISGDLPPRINVNKVVKAANGYLYAGTDYGPYFSTNGGLNWSWLGDRNMPVVPVNDLVIHQASNTLYVGTYGRGIWSYNLATVVPLEEKDRTAGLYGKQLLKNFPNPVTTYTKVQFQVNNAQNLFVAIYDLSGREVKVLLNKGVEADKLYDLNWDRTDGNGSKVQTGGYILRAIGDKVTMARKLTVQ